MAITFPRAEPDALKLVGMTFDLDDMGAMSGLRSGKVYSVSTGPDLWKASYETAPREEEDYGVIRAWRASLMSRELFYGYDRLREYPLLYRNGWGGLTVGGNPFDGTSRIVSVTDATMLALNLLPVEFGLREGDFLAFNYGVGNDSRALHMVVAGGDASALGALTVEVRPHIRLGWVAGATVMLRRPAAKMFMRHGSWSSSVDGNRHGRCSFEAIQSL